MMFTTEEKKALENAMATDAALASALEKVNDTLLNACGILSLAASALHPEDAQAYQAIQGAAQLLEGLSEHLYK